jgi:acyl carrier protein
MELATQLEEQIVSLVMSAVPEGCRKVKITPGTSLQKELGLDSLAVLALMFRFEETFHVDLSQEKFDVARMRTVGDLIATGKDIVQRRVP